MGPPSARSVGRLAAQLDAELGDLQRDVDDELRLVEVLRDAGEARAARLLLEIPVGRLRSIDGRLRGVVAAAAVEREAERTIRAASLRVRRDRGSRSRLAPVIAATVAFAAIALGGAPEVTPTADQFAAATDRAPTTVPMVGPQDDWPLSLNDGWPSSLNGGGGSAFEGETAAASDRPPPATRPPAEPRVPAERAAVAESEPAREDGAASDGSADEAEDGADRERALSRPLQDVVEDVIPWGSDEPDVVSWSPGR